jgi:NTE family protein
VNNGSNSVTPRVGLVLGGGGLAGFAYMTATLKALQDVTDWDPRSAQVIVGTSAGANAAAFLRAGRGIQESYDELATLDGNPETRQRLKDITGNRKAFVGLPDSTTSRELVRSEFGRGRHLRPGRLLSAVAPSGPVPTDRVGDEVRPYITSWPDEELIVTAIRMDDGERVAFDGSLGSDLIDAIEASSAIPGFFTPVEIAGVSYIDGGVHSPTNGDLLMDRDLHLIIMIAPMSVRSYTSGVRQINGPLRVFWKRKVAAEVRQLEQAGHQVLLFEPSNSVARAMGPTMMDVDRTADILKATQRSSKAMFESQEVWPYLSLLSSI